MSGNVPETPEKEPVFDLSRMTEREVAAEIARRIAAFKQARHLTEEDSNPEADATRELPSGATAPSSLFAAPADAERSDAQPSPFLHGHLLQSPVLHSNAISQAARRRKIGELLSQDNSVFDGAPDDRWRAEVTPHAESGADEQRALYSSDFSALLINEEDEGGDERILQLKLAEPLHAPTRRRPHHVPLLAGIAAAVLVTVLSGALIWQLSSGARPGQPAGPAATLAAPEMAPGMAVAAAAHIEAAHAPRLAPPSPSDAVVELPSPNTSGPRLVAALKPAAPVRKANATTHKPIKPSVATAARGPFDPLLDFLSPLTNQFDLAGQGGTHPPIRAGGNGRGEAGG